MLKCLMHITIKQKLEKSELLRLSKRPNKLCLIPALELFMLSIYNFTQILSLILILLRIIFALFTQIREKSRIQKESNFCYYIN